MTFGRASPGGVRAGDRKRKRRSHMNGYLCWRVGFLGEKTLECYNINKNRLGFIGERISECSTDSRVFSPMKLPPLQ